MSRLKPWLTLCRVHVRILNPDHDAAPAAEAIRVALATRDELMRAADDPQMGLRGASIDAALARGDICAATFVNDRMVSYVWRSFSTAPHVDGLWVEFERPYRYSYKAFTLPDYRGQHLQDDTVRLTDAMCVERGYPYAIGFVETHNFASLRADTRHGNQHIGWAGYIKLFGRVYPFRSPGARRHTFRFVMHPPEVGSPDTRTMADHGE